MTKRLTIGYYGNGKSMNRYHLPFLMRRQDTIFVKTIYAPTLRDDWAKWESVHCTDKLGDLLNDPEIDIIVITTPAPVHYETVKQVLEADKNLVLEKPFTQSVKESQELFDLARKKGFMIQGYQNRRFDSNFLTTQAVITSGKLNGLLEVGMHYDYYRSEVPENVTQYSKDESYVYNHACHTVDQVISHFDKLDDVHYDVRQLLGAGRMDDYSDIDFYHQNSADTFHVTPGGLKVSVRSSYFKVKERPSSVVYGRRGMFVKYEKDRQEAGLKKFYLSDNDDFGLDKPENFGTLTYYGDSGYYHGKAVETVAGDNSRFYNTLYETLINHKPILVTEEQTVLQIHTLEEVTKDLK